MFVVDVFLFGESNANEGSSEYKALGKAGITVINSVGAAQHKNPNSSGHISSVQKMLVLYRSKKETLITSHIAGAQFVFDIQNENYGCFYTNGRNQQKVRHKCTI